VELLLCPKKTNNDSLLKFAHLEMKRLDTVRLSFMKYSSDMRVLNHDNYYNEEISIMMIDTAQ
jgi:hypothetical protein